MAQQAPQPRWSQEPQWDGAPRSAFLSSVTYIGIDRPSVSPVVAVRFAADRLSGRWLGWLLGGFLNGSLSGTRTLAVPVEL